MLITVLNSENKLQEVDIKPDLVSMIALGGVGFQVMGQHRMHHQCVGDIDEFVKALPNASNFVKFSWVGDTEHGEFWANALQVKQVRAVTEAMKQHYQTAKSDIVFIGGNNRIVTIDQDDVVKQLRQAGGEIPDPE